MGFQKLNYLQHKQLLIDITKGVSKKILLKKYNIGDTTFYEMKKRMPDKEVKSKDFEVRVDFFRKINSEEKAYWLGFIAADGCVYNNVLEVASNIKDTKHIAKLFRKSLNSSQDTPYHDKKQNTIKYRLCRKEICDDLATHGIIPRKTFKLEFPTTVPKKYLHHFIRGYFDGDGSVTFNKNRNCYRYMFYGNLSFLSELAKYIKYTNRIYNSGTIYVIDKNSKKDCGRFFKYLYKNASIFLERKRDKFLEIMNL